MYGTKINVLDYITKGGVKYRIVSDHLGSVRLVVNIASGEIAQRIDYDEFGNILQNTNPDFQPFGFAGGIFDQHTNLTRFGARDYDAYIGRWIAKDPLLFEGLSLNPYIYASNDPISFVDFSGKRPQSDLDSQEPEAITKKESSVIRIRKEGEVPEPDPSFCCYTSEGPVCWDPPPTELICNSPGRSKIQKIKLGFGRALKMLFDLRNYIKGTTYQEQWQKEEQEDIRRNKGCTAIRG